jgi:PAS domain S-box-containing protein
MLAVTLVPICLAAVSLIALAQLGLRRMERHMLASMQQLERHLRQANRDELVRLAMVSAQKRADNVYDQLELYLQTRPDVSMADLRADPQFQVMAVQSVGRDGYTCLLDRDTGKILWHAHEEFVGIGPDEMAEVSPELAEMVRRAAVEPVVRGEYDWIDPDKRQRRKYLYLRSIERDPIEGSRLMLAATMYIDESAPLARRIGADVSTQMAAGHARSVQLAALLRHSMILVAVVVLAAGCFLAVRLSGRVNRRLKALVGLSNRLAKKFGQSIKLGETGDELERLSQSFHRMAGRVVSQQAKLRAHQSHLEWEVRKRTLELEQEVREHEQAEHELSASLRFLQTLIDTIPSPIFCKDSEGRYSAVNRAFTESILAGDAERLIGKTTLELPDVPAEIARRLYESDQVLLLCGGEEAYEETIPTADGSHRRFVIRKRAYRDDQDRIAGMVGVLQDITEREKRQAENARLAAGLAQAEEAVLILDQAGRISFANPAFERIAGFPPSEALGAQVARLLCRSPEEMGLVDEIWDSLQAGKPWKGTFTAFGKQGEPFEARMSIAPIRDERGQVSAYVAALSDITQDLELQAKLAQSQKLQSIGQLAAGIAHEINTPAQYVGDNIRFIQESLAPLREVLTLLTEQLAAATSSGADPTDADPAEAPSAEAPDAEPDRGAVECHQARRLREAVDACDLPYLLDELPNATAESLAGVQRISTIVSAMKEFAKPHTLDRPVAVDINRVVEGVSVIARNEYKYVAELELDLDEQMPLVYCVPDDINQAVLNLLINAADAVEQVISPDAGEKGRITLRTVARPGWADIHVIDTGQGISEDVRDKIFDPFFTTKEVGAGVGQGLSVVHGKVVKRHGGKIDFTTTPGKGTEFVISLPIDGPAASADSQGGDAGKSTPAASPSSVGGDR